MSGTSSGAFLTMPGPFTPLVDSNGVISGPWYQFFQQLMTRIGAANPGAPLATQVPQIGTTATLGLGIAAYALMES